MKFPFNHYIEIKIASFPIRWTSIASIKKGLFPESIIVYYSCELCIA